MPKAPDTVLHATLAEQQHCTIAMQTMPLLETPRLRLRAFTAASKDIDDLHELLADGRHSSRVYLFRQPFNRQAATDWINDSLAMQHDGIGVYVAMEDKATGRLAGELHIDCWPEYKSAEYGYIIHPMFEGEGYASEAAIYLNDWLLGAAGFKLICATTALDNNVSMHILDKVGFTRQPQGRICIRPDGSERPSSYFELDRTAWLASRNAIMTKHLASIDPDFAAQARSA
jgi:RimJ/RimL family protein N-acetyltransferase